MTFRIESEFGIGSGSVFLARGSWPDVVRFRLYLGGLEGFSIAFDGLQLAKEDLHVQARDRLGRAVETRYLNQLSPRQRRGAYYEVTLPRETKLPVREKIKLHWVDFYRG